MANTITLVPLGTYQPIQRTFTGAIPAGTTAIDVTIHAPVQNPPFAYEVDFAVSPDGATWTPAGSAACNCKATDTVVHIPCAGMTHVQAAVDLTTQMTVQVTATTEP